MATDKLNARQEKFCHEYMVDLNGKQAAIRAGYAARSAEVTASQLLRIPKVMSFLAKLRAKQVKRVELDADYVLTSLQEVAERCMQRVPVMARDEDGNEYETGEYRFEHAGANRALELLGKHLALFNDKLDVNVGFDPSKHSDDELRAIIESRQS